MYKLLIVDDEPLVQAGIKSMLNWNELEIEICGTAMNGQSALKIIEKSSPDIVLTDIKMPIMSGLELAKICYERYGNLSPAFIILTSYEDFHMAREALTYQVSDYLVKLELTPENLRESVETVLKRIQASSAAGQNDLSDVHPYYDKFFIRLLNNLFESEEQFQLQSSDLKLDFHYPYYICCYGEMISEQADLMSLEKQMQLFNSSLQMLHELTGKYLSCYCLSLDIKHFALIFYREEKPDASYGSDIRDIFQNVSSSLSNYFNVSLRCGIGSCVCSPSSVSDSYQYARQAFSFTDKEQAFVFFEDCLKNEAYRNSFNISLFKDNLTKAFEEYDPDILRETLSEICTLFTGNQKNYVQMLDAACNILYLSLSMIQDGEEIISGIFKEYPEGYRSIYKQSTVEQLVIWLTFFQEQLCLFFEEKRRDYKNHIVSNVKKYIHKNVAKRLTLNEVAAVFGISPNYLSQLFKKYNDMGFNEYVTLCKVNEAKHLLTDSNYKVYEVAEMLGFESAFYFSKVFKKVEGVSPTEYLNVKLL